MSQSLAEFYAELPPALKNSAYGEAHRLRLIELMTAQQDGTSQSGPSDFVTVDPSGSWQYGQTGRASGSRS